VDIAISSNKSFQTIFGKKPNIAMLSYSTKGSAKHENIDKLVNVVNKVKNIDSTINIDGELQLDAAIIKEVANIKAPSSNVAGKADLLIFPNLEAGNIGYKIAQRFGNMIALGPITQGLKKPVNDLSRGCNVDDIVGVVAITCIQATDGI
jgi:phosphate acetyltransferase